MIIYLEGVDGTGKSTLANYLVGALDEMYYPEVILEPEDEINTRIGNGKSRVTEKQLFSVLKKWAKDNKVHILDRGPLSDIVYRMFDTQPTVTSFSKLLDFIHEYGNRIFIIHCDSDNAETNMLKRGDENPISKKYHLVIRNIYKLCFEMIDGTTYNCDSYNYDNKNDINKIVSRIGYFVYMAYRGEK